MAAFVLQPSVYCTARDLKSPDHTSDLSTQLYTCRPPKYSPELQVFSCEICEIFKNNIFEEHLRMTTFMIRGKRKGNREREGQSNKPAPKTDFSKSAPAIKITFTISIIKYQITLTVIS